MIELLKSIIVTFEIAAPASGGFAMTWKYSSCHCEEQSDEAISHLFVVAEL
jgi:hypothetical protein